MPKKTSETSSKFDLNKEKDEIKKETKRAVSEFKKEVVDKQDPNVIAAIGYVWILFFIPLFFKRNNEFCQHHGKQSFVLLVFSVLVTFVSFIPLIGWVIAPFGWLAYIVLMILGVMNALRGERWEMPYLGKYAKKIKF